MIAVPAESFEKIAIRVIVLAVMTKRVIHYRASLSGISGVGQMKFCNQHQKFISQTV